MNKLIYTILSSATLFGLYVYTANTYAAETQNNTNNYELYYQPYMGTVTNSHSVSENLPVTALSLTPESAQLIGSVLANDGSIDLKKGKVLWGITLPHAGNYRVEFDYRSPYGEKSNTFFVGNQAKKVFTAQNSTIQTISIDYLVSEGQIDVGVDGSNNNWGYIFIDQVRVINTDMNSIVEQEYPGTRVTESTRDNYQDFANTIPNVKPADYIGQDEQVKNVGSYGNIYDKSLYGDGFGENVGIVWAGWNPSHYLDNKSTKMAIIDQYNIKRISFIPTYFIADYQEGIRCNDDANTLSVAQQVNLLKELTAKGIRINYRPHIDPIKFSWLSATPDMNPGYKDWRGLFESWILCQVIIVV